jgi:NADPH-ferrihemoprotein reductase
MQYKTGDDVAVWPANPRNEVDILLKGLNLYSQQDNHLVIEPTNIDGKTLQIPSPTTYRALFEWYLEIAAPVSRAIIHGLSPFAPTSEAKDLLLRLSGDRSDYTRYCAQTQLTFGCLLQLASPWSHGHIFLLHM